MNASFNPQYQPYNPMFQRLTPQKSPAQTVPADAFPPPDLDLLQSNVREIKPERKTSMPVAVGSLIGTLAPMAIMAAMQGKFKDAKGLKKALAPFMVDYGVKEILALGGTAILGGLAGGVINDKGKDTWAKVKEGNYQFITNIMMPVLFCKLYESMAEKLEHQVPKLAQLASKNKFTQITRATVISLLGIVSGVTTGAFLSNQLNKRIHKDEIPPRKIHAKDFLIQADDMAAGFTVTGALKSIPVLCHVDKVLPLVYLISGMETGNEKGDKNGEAPSGNGKAVT
ncbi:MAG: hypothetical protein LW809_07110 [Vampirovibrionales bacterium]|nr:hypothetical protein [Vampirovibrionales bacterium]